MTQRLLRAIQAHGVRPEGYCFCAPNRIGDAHQGECIELQAAIAEAEQMMSEDLAPHTAREIEEAAADLKRAAARVRQVNGGRVSLRGMAGDLAEYAVSQASISARRSRTPLVIAASDRNGENAVRVKLSVDFESAAPITERSHADGSHRIEIAALSFKSKSSAQLG